MKNVPTPAYDVNDPGFETLARTICLSTTSYFAYSPSTDVLRARLAKELKRPVDSIPKDFAADKPMWEDFQKAKNDMLQAEENKPYTKRQVSGDASETGLIKFVQPLFMGGDYGCYNKGGLDGVRKSYPMAKGVDGVDAIIPFASDIKFNLIVRDMNTSDQSPADADNNLWIFLKGAPERVFGRCKYILVDGQDKPLTDSDHAEIKAANDKFGNCGERVLAFARCKLDPARYNKSYQFDVKKWKMWKEVKEYTD